MVDAIKPTLFQGCFDESGKLADSEIVAFGGCIGTYDQFHALGVKWEKRLGDDGLPYTSMKDAMHARGPYIGWKNFTGKRDAILRDFARMIVESRMLMMSSPMTSSEFKTLPALQRQKLGNDIYYCGFEAVVMGTLHHAPNLVLHVICDLSEEYSEKCIKLFNKLRQKNESVKARCFGISFADDERHSGLQAADMIAYCSRADSLRFLRPPEPIVEEIIAILSEGGTELDSYLFRADSDGLGHGELENLVS